MHLKRDGEWKSSVCAMFVCHRWPTPAHNVHSYSYLAIAPNDILLSIFTAADTNSACMLYNDNVSATSG